jgi:hypothetical protein
LWNKSALSLKGQASVPRESLPDGGWTEQVLHNFGNGTDGYWPCASLIFDAAGNLYGENLERVWKDLPTSEVLAKLKSRPENRGH